MWKCLEHYVPGYYDCCSERVKPFNNYQWTRPHSTWKCFVRLKQTSELIHNENEPDEVA